MAIGRAALIELAQLDKSDVATALRRILQLDSETLGVERVSYWEVAPDHSQITCRAQLTRSTGAFTTGGTLSAQDYPAYFQALLACRTIVADDAATHPHTAEFADSYFRSYGITSMLDIPVWKRGRLAGVICHEHVGRQRSWSLEEQDFVLGVANMVSVALESEERRRAEEGYSMVRAAVSDVVWEWNIETGELRFTEAITRFGYPLERMNTDITWWLSRVHPQDLPRVRDSVQQKLASHDTNYIDEYRFVCCDGRIATVIDRGHIARDEQGAATRMVGSLVDISDRIAMQARLALSERMASIGTLAAGVAHEINNPLTYIMSNLATAIDDVRDGTSDPAVMTEMLSEALEGAQRVRRIVADLQSLSRPPEDVIEHIHVHDVIESSLKVAWNEIRHRAQLVKSLGEVPCVAIDRNRLGQVLLNLVMNAAQAIPEGDIDRHRIRVSTHAHDARVVIEVADTGPGVPQELRRRIFEPFFTTKQVGSGTGLGLSICHSIITGVGGEIDVDMAPEGGSLFRITLPAAEGHLVTSVSTDPVVAPRRILLVEDDPTVRKVLRRMLEPQHEVVTAESGLTALERIVGGERVDVILCDLLMPRMTGMELHDRLNEVAPDEAKRMIFMTGGAFSERASTLVQSGRHIVLEKPLDAIALSHALGTIAPRA